MASSAKKNPTRASSGVSSASHRRGRMTDMLSLHHMPAYFLLACVVVSLYYLISLFQPFVTVIVFAMVLATAFYPLYTWLFAKLRYRNVSAILACIAVTLLIIVPVFVLIFLVASEAVNFYFVFQNKLHAGAYDVFLKWGPGGALYDGYQRFVPNLRIPALDLSGQVSALVQKLSQILLEQSTNLVNGFVSFLLSFLIMLFVLFYFFRDGERIVSRLMQLSPLPDRYETLLVGKLRTVMNATIYGTFLTAIVQGMVGGIGFLIAGVSGAILWGVATAFLSLIPYVGASLVWVPAVAVLFFSGHVGSAVFLLIWGLVLISTIDNILRSFLISSRTKESSLLTFLAVLGGVATWGFPGILFGPLVVNFALTFAEIYRSEYKGLLHDLDHDGI